MQISSLIVANQFCYDAYLYKYSFFFSLLLQILPCNDNKTKQIPSKTNNWPGYHQLSLENKFHTVSTHTKKQITSSPKVVAQILESQQKNLHINF